MISSSTCGANTGFISFSVKSGAGASRTMAATRSGRDRAARHEIQPPMDEPTRTSGPSVSASMTARASARQRLMVPSRKAPSDAPWPK